MFCAFQGLVDMFDVCIWRCVNDIEWYEMNNEKGSARFIYTSPSRHKPQYRNENDRRLAQTSMKISRGALFRIPCMVAWCLPRLVRVCKHCWTRALTRSEIHKGGRSTGYSEYRIEEGFRWWLWLDFGRVSERSAGLGRDPRSVWWRKFGEIDVMFWMGEFSLPLQSVVEVMVDIRQWSFKYHSYWSSWRE